MTAWQKPFLGTQLRSDGHWSTQGLAVYYAMNEFGGGRLFDPSRNGNHGYFQSTGTRPSWNSGGIQFFGGDGIYVLDNDSLDMPTGQMSIFIKFKAAGNCYLVDKNVWNEYKLEMSGTQLIWTVSADGIVDVVSGLGAVSTNTIHTAVVTYDGASQRIFVDGVFWKSGAQTGAINSSAANLFIGKRELGAPLTGYIYCFYIYNRALSPANAQELYMYPYIALKQPSRAKYFFLPTGVTLPIFDYYYRQKRG